MFEMCCLTVFGQELRVWFWLDMKNIAHTPFIHFDFPFNLPSSFLHKTAHWLKVLSLDHWLTPIPSQLKLPWYNRTGWLGVKHQFTYSQLKHGTPFWSRKLSAMQRNCVFSSYKLYCNVLQLMSYSLTECHFLSWNVWQNDHHKSIILIMI